MPPLLLSGHIHLAFRKPTKICRSSRALQISVCGCQRIGNSNPWPTILTHENPQLNPTAWTGRDSSDLLPSSTVEQVAQTDPTMLLRTTSQAYLSERSPCRSLQATGQAGSSNAPIPPTLSHRFPQPTQVRSAYFRWALFGLIF